MTVVEDTERRYARYKVDLSLKESNGLEVGKWWRQRDGLYEGDSRNFSDKWKVPIEKMFRNFLIFYRDGEKDGRGWK